jgi:ABC-type transport system involved in cytochrome bd biosynthesis fused ATPase/permease subunit
MNRNGFVQEQIHVDIFFRLLALPSIAIIFPMIYVVQVTNSGSISNGLAIFLLLLIILLIIISFVYTAFSYLKATKKKDKPTVNATTTTTVGIVETPAVSSAEDEPIAPSPADKSKKV